MKQLQNYFRLRIFLYYKFRKVKTNIRDFSWGSQILPLLVSTANILPLPILLFHPAIVERELCAFGNQWSFWVFQLVPPHPQLVRLLRERVKASFFHQRLPAYEATIETMKHTFWPKTFLAKIQNYIWYFWPKTCWYTYLNGRCQWIQQVVGLPQNSRLDIQTCYNTSQ